VLQQLRFEKADYFVSNNSAFNQALSEEQRVELYASRQQALWPVRLPNWMISEKERFAVVGWDGGRHGTVGKYFVGS
jgi:hypothetical protein